jgi:lipoprotein-anchoring transpeptidase ErfK/SrfK
MAKRYSSRSRRRKLRPGAVAALLLIVAALGAGGYLIVGHLIPQSKPVSASSPTGKAAPSSSAAVATSPVQVSITDAVKPFRIHVSIEDQQVTIYDANDKILQQDICSTGSPGYDTPKGTFTINGRGPEFYASEYQEGAYYWVSFYGYYYFHSVPFDKNHQTIQSVAQDLGHVDSHGCVHLKLEDSEWIYDNVPDGTKVVID